MAARHRAARASVRKQSGPGEHPAVLKRAGTGATLVRWKTMMKTQLAILAVLVLAVAQDASSEGPSYQLADGFFKLAAGRKIGSTAGITVDRDGRNIWVFDRCGGQNCVGSDVAPIQKFDASGAVIKSFGAGMFVRPHGIHIDRDGNIWVTDCLLYTSDAADERSSVDLGGRRI